MFADDTVGALRRRKVSGRVRGVEMRVFHSVHVDASVDAVVVLKSRPVKMSAVLVVVE